MSALMPGSLIVIRPDGTRSIEPLDKAPELAKLQEIVGGYIEAVPHFTTFEGSPCRAFCNEDGKRDLPYNAEATLLWALALGVPLPILLFVAGKPVRDYLAGPIAIIAGDKAFLRKL